MSNWLKAKISTTIKNPRRDVFEQALEDMGYRPDYSKKEVHGSFSSEASEPVDCVLVDTHTGRESTVGFTFTRSGNDDVVLSVTGDFWNFRHDGKRYTDGEEFMKQLGLRYNYRHTRAVMEESGYTIEETTQENDRIVMVGYRQVA